MKRIIVSLFDRQKDYGEAKTRQHGSQETRPSVAIAQHRSAMNSTRYVLLFEPRYEDQANSIVTDIGRALAKNRHDDSKDDIVRDSGRAVTLLPVHYGKNGVWNISATTRAINSALQELTQELNETVDDIRLFVNTINGTAEQRTALALWAYSTTLERTSRRLKAKITKKKSSAPKPSQEKTRFEKTDNERPVTTDCFFVRLASQKSENEHLARIQLEFIKATDAQSPFGFFQCKFNTQNLALRSSLAQLECLLKRIQVGLDDTILLTGPSGAGKTMVAKMCMKFLQCLNPTIKDEHCVHMNMAAVAENLFESELFGHVKGAFTGAIADKEGLVEKANGGILFLDEIGELPLHLQSKLLTFLDTGKFRKVGGTEIEESKFVLICGTNRNLESAIPTHFRRDLYERINMWHFDIPGLHERPEDLETALRRELAIWNDTTRSGARFMPDARQRLLDHLRSVPLEGNYREFHAIVRRLLTLSDDSTVTVDDVNREIRAKDKVSPTGKQDVPIGYDLADLSQLAAALAVCKSAKNGREAGEMLFAATKANVTAFNGSAYFQRIFTKFGLKVKFKDGRFDAIERIANQAPSTRNQRTS